MLLARPVVATSTQLVPEYHCHLPSVVALAPFSTTAIASRLFAVDPFALLSLLSEKVLPNTLVILEPVMLISSVSSLTEGRYALPLAIGLSLIAVTAVVRVTCAEL